jgi:hypothetical protein
MSEEHSKKLDSLEKSIEGICAEHEKAAEDSKRSAMLALRARIKAAATDDRLQGRLPSEEDIDRTLKILSAPLMSELPMKKKQTSDAADALLSAQGNERRGLEKLDRGLKQISLEDIIATLGSKTVGEDQNAKPPPASDNSGGGKPQQ